MCILFLYLNDDPEKGLYRFIVANNRDEYWDRPTATADVRGDQHQWVGGIDLQPGKEGGTWIGMSKTGRFAVLLNILSNQKLNMKGRGHWVPGFLTTGVSCEEYLETVGDSMDQCDPFQLLLTDLREIPNCVHYISNKESRGQRKLKPGVHSCGNSSDFDIPWKKTEEGQKTFEKIVTSCSSVTEKEKLIESIIDLLTDKTQHLPDPQLAKQFEESGQEIGSDVMKRKSAIHVWIPQYKYVTRTNTVILVDFHNNCDYFERTLETPVDCDNPKYSTVSYSFKLET